MTELWSLGTEVAGLYVRYWVYVDEVEAAEEEEVAGGETSVGVSSGAITEDSPQFQARVCSEETEHVHECQAVERRGRVHGKHGDKGRGVSQAQGRVHQGVQWSA